MSNPKRVLLTGGAGFIGHHLIESIFKNTNWEIVILDRLDVSGNLNRLPDMSMWEEEKYRVKFILHDVKAALNESILNRIGDIDYILHLAAGSHVDRSITHPMEFAMDNTIGTVNLLDYARDAWSGLPIDCGKKFLYFSTDEVYGPAPGQSVYSEGDAHNPSNPYAAAKSAAEAFCRSYRNTYKLPIVITNTMNVFGERQHPEKFIPSVIKNVMTGGQVTIHSDSSRTIAGSRFYIHARNVSEAVLFVLEKGLPFSHGEHAAMGTYHIVGEQEVNNLQLAQFIARVVGKPLNYKMVDFHSSRPGHDLRYGMSGKKLKDLGFDYPKSFEDSLEKTIRWYLARQEWLNA